MELLVVSVVALLASGLTLFSGFGLGTLLLPAFLIFFAPDIAVAMTGIVHLLNNLFKLVLLGRDANANIVARFGFPAVIAALAGAWLLVQVSDAAPLATYSLGERLFSITAVKLAMGLLIAAFAALEFVPSLSRIEFDKKYLPIGGMLSGFFGGLSGHQGALRSAFLVRAGLSKEAFVATGVVVACMVDAARLSVYARHFAAGGLKENFALLAIATLSAFAGVFIGSKLLQKITMQSVQTVVSVMLFVIALLLCFGLV